MDWKKILDERIEEFFLVISMVVMVFLIFLQSASRYITGNSFSWGTELVIYLHIWQIWIGASLGIRKGEHVRVDAFLNLFKGKINLILNLLALIAWFIFAIFLATEGTKFVSNLMNTGQTSASLGAPMWLVYTVIPLGGILMCIRLIQQIYLLFKQPDKELPKIS